MNHRNNEAPSPPKGGATAIDGISASRLERRRNFAARQNLRREAYRDVTSFEMFPLQAMAMGDFDGRLEDYLSAGEICGGDGSEEDDAHSERPEGALRRTKKLGEGRSSMSEWDRLRERFRREFSAEKSMEAPAAAAAVGATAAEGRAKNGDQAGITATTIVDASAADVVSYRGETSPGDNDGESEEHRKNSIENSGESKSQDQEWSESPEIQQEKMPSSSEGQRVPWEEKSKFGSTLWSMEPRLFAMETAIKGKRRYISAHLGRFMDHYWRERGAHDRHYYELIRESTPCRLYFDLEFSKRANPLLTPDVTEDLLSQLFDELRRQYQNTYDISIERSCMVDLDSSTPKKFSRHWILHLPNGELFSDAREAGIFVKRLVSRLEEEERSGELQERGHDLLANNLFVNGEDSGVGNAKPTRFIDLGVYTRNRIFRLMGSTKFGKPADAALRIAEANEFHFPGGFDNSKFYLPEMIKGATDDSDATDTDGDFESFCNSLSWEDHADAMAATLIVPANASKMGYPTLDNPSNLLSDDEKQQIIALRHLNGSGVGGSMSRYPRTTPSYGSSPLPKLEHFIANTLAMRNGLVGSIGTWSLGTHSPIPRTMSFNMKGNRYCENIGRAHKSNQIIWNVYLVDRICWQGCHDPDCRGFRGEPIDLPEEVDAEIDEYFLDFELSSLNEDEIVGNKENEEAAAAEDGGEFDDPALDVELAKLNISNVARESEADVALDVELAKLNLSDLVSSSSGKRNPLSEKTTQSTDALKQTKHTNSEPACDNSTTRPSEPWENDDTLDLELAELNLSDIVSR